MVNPDGEGRARSGKDLDAERRILAAAHEVFLRRGTAGARMQEIADEAGVNKALLHYYFRNKERLAQAVFEEAAVEMFGFVFQLLRSPAAVEEKVRAVVAAEVEFLMARPYLPGYILSELHHNPERITRIVGTVGTPPLEVLRSQLEEGARAGRLRRIGVEEFVIDLVSLTVFPFAGRAMIEALLGMDEERFRAFLEARKRGIPDLILNALRP
jgi:AcrR family transcriptional regulator